MNRKLAFVVGCFFLVGCSERSAPTIPASPPVVRAGECRWRADALTLDGQLDDVGWKNAQVLTDYAVFWQHRAPRTKSRAMLLWDDEYLWFAGDMEDSDLYADIEQRNGMTWSNDVFELFFKPHKEKLTYYEFQVNALNTQLELFLPSRGAGGYQRFGPTTRLGMESAVKLHGTLNQWQDQDKGWTVEGRIPWTAFTASGGKPTAGSSWSFALCRYDYSTAFERVDLSSTAPLTQADFHRYEDYSVLTFTPAKGR